MRRPRADRNTLFNRQSGSDGPAARRLLSANHQKANVALALLLYATDLSSLTLSLSLSLSVTGSVGAPPTDCHHTATASDTAGAVQGLAHCFD